MIQTPSADCTRRLMAGVSAGALVLCMTAVPAHAQLAAMRAAAGTVAPPGSVVASGATPARSVTMQDALARQTAMQSRAQAVAKYAASAHNAAIAAIKGLPSDGISDNGLNPIVTVRAATIYVAAGATTTVVAANAVPASVAAINDPTGLNTWDGAKAPVQTTDSSGKVTVRIDQTQQRALLSWHNFDISANTALVFNQKDASGAAQQSWTVVNRVVNSASPSRILGSITASGTVLILNGSGVLFGPGSQVNLHSLIASSLELGNFASGTSAVGQNLFFIAANVKDRNTAYLQNGLLVQGLSGFKAQILSSLLPAGQYAANSALPQTAEGGVYVYSGASITADAGGMIILAAPTVINAGTLSASDGQVSLQGGRLIGATPSTGATGSADVNVRGLILNSQVPSIPVAPQAPSPDQGIVVNYGVITSRRGYISLGTAPFGTVTNSGLLQATTSVSRNGKIALTGGAITLSGADTQEAASGVAILPDDNGEAIPQGTPDSPPSFKTSQITIGDAIASYLTIDGSNDIALLPAVFTMQKNAFIFAPNANVVIGHDVSAGNFQAIPAIAASVTIADLAVIDVSGMKAVPLAVSANSVKISPAKQNELRDTPNYRSVSTDGSFTLNGATLYVDARISGVRSDGVAWVGSPLIEAGSAVSQIPVSAAVLMTKGGTVSIDVGAVTGSTNLDPSSVPIIAIAKGALFDISGGWVTYGAGTIITSELVTSDGRVVNIASADPNDSFVGVVNGFTATQPKFGLSQTYSNAALQGQKTQDAYDEGRDAGALEIVGTNISFFGTIAANAFAGSSQLAAAIAPNTAASLSGDPRKLQYSKYQLPTGGLLRIGSFSGSSGIGLGQDIVVYDGTRAANLAELALSDIMLSKAGLGALMLQTSGAVTLTSDAALILADGGILNVDAGRSIAFDGKITAPGGKIAARTYQLSTIASTGVGTVGNPFRSDDDIALSYASTEPLPQRFDIAVNGTLSVAGKWVNDYLNAGLGQGSGWINGGSIALTVAPKVFVPLDGTLLTANVAGDLSGSIRINAGALLDVSAGAYVSDKRKFNLSATGGNISLIDQTTYTTLAPLVDNVAELAGSTVSGQSVAFTPLVSTAKSVGVRPSLAVVRQTSVVKVADGTLRGFGFGGGGTFTLVSPDVAVGAPGDANATLIQLDFLQRTGFGTLDLTSYHARSVTSLFDNGSTGLSNFSDTTTVTVGAGQTLDLTQVSLPGVLSTSAQQALLALASGGDIGKILTPAVPASAWYRKAANLTLRGLMELDVAAGGAIVGAAQASIITPKLYNAGLITLVGGKISQVATLTSALNGGGIGLTAATGFSAVFGAPDANGHYAADGVNALGLTNADGSVQTNNQIFTTPGHEHFLYFLGTVGTQDGIVLAPGSTTNLAGAALINPDAPLKAGGGQYVFGKLIGGGSITTAAPLNPTSDLTQALFANPAYGFVSYPDPTSTSPTPPPILAQTAARAFVASAGATIDISGAAATFDVPVSSADYAPSLQWSDAGTIALRAGGTLAGAMIAAKGGSVAATGGALEWFAPTINAALADQIGKAGFSTLIADGGLTLDGSFTLSLGKALVVRSAASIDGTVIGANAAVSIAATQGTDATIAAPYIVFASRTGAVATSGIATGNATVTFSAGASGMDLFGSVLFDASIGQTNLSSLADVRLSGVDDRTGSGQAAVLNGSLVAAGNLTFDASRVYTTTGTGNLQRILEDAAGATDLTLPLPYLLEALGASTITFLGNHINATAPFSAGSYLEILADNVVQNGYLAAPLGKIAFGTAANPLNGLEFGTSSVTVVSGAGLNVPYGTTTDLTQLFFAPGISAPLSQLPSGSLAMTANTINISLGSKVLGAGGGDVFAYEFVSGTGGSRDLLNRFNSDTFSANGYNTTTGVGYQFADQRQVYALVPTATAQKIALYDPIYSSDYGTGGPASLYGTNAALAVTLDGGDGIVAGQYVLMPAHYALLPGAYRVVENVGTVAPAAGVTQVQRDGSVVMGGVYSTAGTALSSSQRRSFTLESQSTFLKYSSLHTTSDTTVIQTAAAGAGISVPRLPLDAARVVLDPLKALNVAGAFDTTPSIGGRGSEIDILGTNIVLDGTGSSQASGLILTNATLTNLNANSLMIGGERIENSDDTTRLGITASSISVLANANIAVPELILAVAGAKSSINIRNGAKIAATGTLADSRAGNYVVTSSAAATGSFDSSGVGSVLRVSNGVQRQVVRTGAVAAANAKRNSQINIGAASIAGKSLLIETNHDFKISDNAALTVGSIAISASNIAFGEKSSIDGKLAAKLAAADAVSLTSAQIIGFDPGSMLSFHNLSIDAPGLALTGSITAPAQVSITSGDTRLANTSKNQAAGCTVKAATACGTTGNSFILNTTSVTLGSGNFNLYSFDGAVNIAATKGVYVEGLGTLQANKAALTITTPFIADRAAVVDPTTAGKVPSDAILPKGEYTIPVTPDYGFVTGGTVALVNGGAAALTPAGLRAPGAHIAFGSSAAPVAAMTIDGVAISATAGIIDIESRQSITLAGSAALATTGYSRSYNDTLSTTTVSAGAGTVNLVSLSGDIIVPTSASLSVDNGIGNAGRLNLIAADGAVSLAGQLNSGVTGVRAASLSVDTGTAAFDLDGFATRYGALFQGDIAVRSGAGDLTLAAGHTLRATGVILTSDGGSIAISGTINTSGVAVVGLTTAQVNAARVSGGDVALWGRDGVSLLAGGRIDTHTMGYANTDQRQASAGNVTIGIGNTGGAITIASGAAIDLGARRSGNRLIAQTVKDPDTLVDKVVYQFVAADTGGTLSLRAPVIGGSSNLVNIALHGHVTGAAVQQVEAYKTYNLDLLLANAGYDGISGGGSTVTLDPTPTGFNILSDTFIDVDGTQSIPYFIQNFAVTARDGSDLSAMRLRPGVDIVSAKSISLAAQWNLAAGTLDSVRAQADGLLTALPELGKRADGTPYYAITPGNESKLLSEYVAFLYRVGGKASGEAGVFSFEAGGKLDIANSISDGFFTFADKSDAAYINYQLGGGNRTYNLALELNCGSGLNCSGVTGYSAVTAGTVAADATNTATINLAKYFTGNQLGSANVLAPYDPEANTAIALGNNTDPVSGNQSGDALGFAQLFPRLTDGSAVHSSSLRLVAGTGMTGSADPLHVDRASAADVVVEGETGYMLTAAAGAISTGKVIDLKLALENGTVASFPSFGLADLIGTSSTLGHADTLTDDSYTAITWGSRTTEATDLRAAAKAFFAGSKATFTTNSVGVAIGVAAPLAQMLAFLQSITPAFLHNVATHASGYPSGAPTPPTLINYGSRSAFTRTLVRTGDGTIDVAASGNVDLRNGATATYRNENGTTVSASAGAQVGGTAIYTAGVRVSAAPVIATLIETNAQVSLAPSSVYANFSSQNPTFLPSPKGLDEQAAVLASGGGAVSINAGGSLLARRDVWSETYLNKGALAINRVVSSYLDTAIGDAAQRWRPGSVGQDTEILIAPKYFNSGIGALAGGNVAIITGGVVRDLTLALDSATTTAASAVGAVAISLGKGDLTARIGGDVQAGQFDVASGTARIDVGGSVVGFGTQPNPTTSDKLQYLRVRLAQANIALSASGSIALAGVSALGAARGDSSIDEYNQAGFFKPSASFSATAIGNLAYEDNRLEQTVPFQIGTGGAGGFGGAVLPPTLGLASLTGSLTAPSLPLLLYPSVQGNLQLFSAGDITNLVIAMSDSDISLLPGQFSAAKISLESINGTGSGNVTAQTGLGFGIPGVGPTTSDDLLRLYHYHSNSQNLTHSGDTAPVLIHAGNDLANSLINLPKAALISAGRDISDLYFTGQNANATDTTVISAGRDLTGTTASSLTLNLPYIVSSDFVLGGSGSLVVEAGRNIGPFINSAIVRNVSYAGGIQTVGNLYNPWLASGGADLTLLFGIAGGVNYAALRGTYLDPANFAKLDSALFVPQTDSLGISHPDRTKQIYAPILAQWLRTNSPASFAAVFGATTYKDTADGNAALTTAAYGQSAALFKVFAALDPLLQDRFLIKDVLFTELEQPALPTGPSYLQYVRGYRAIQTLFPASAGYTDNLAVYTVNSVTVTADHPLGVPTRNLVDGQPQKATTVSTGNADLRLSTLQTADGGDLTIVSPGGNFIAGSVVRTSTQAAGRVTRFGVDQTAALAYGQLTNANVQRISAIPIGYEGLLTLNGGAIRSFTDGNFLVNQSRVFTEAGGDIVMWSSNGDLNAGQGPRSASNFPPVSVRFDLDGYAQVDSAGSVSGAGIGAFQRHPTDPASSIILVAPAGLVDAGDAGVRATGNVLVAAAHVANADSFSAGGSVSGVPAAAATPAAANPAAASSAVAAQGSSTQANNDNADRRTIITVEVLGYVSGVDPCDDSGVSDPDCRRKANGT